jgi:hypothetical protein
MPSCAASGTVWAQSGFERLPRGARSATRLLALLAALSGSACAVSQEVGSDCVDEASCERAWLQHTEQARGGVPVATSMSIDRPQATRSGFIRHVDVLLVVSSSPAMIQPQRLLADAMRHFVTVLASGDTDGVGAPNFRAPTDVHFGVISGRMQTAPEPGESALDAERSCSGGSDGELSSFGCLPQGHTFASLQSDDVASTGDALACMMQVGAKVCEPPQLLDSTLRALWPTEAHGGLAGTLRFGDGSSLGWPENAGFLRDDSLIVTIVVADSDDCSLAMPAGLAALDATSLLHRCSVTPDVRFDVSRYVNGLRALRPGAEDLVMFFAIAGVPPGQVSPEVLRAVSFERDDQRNAFYDALLNSAYLQPGASDDRGTIDPSDDLPRSVCTMQSGPIFPARRLIELARAFGQNGLVQSLCANSYTPAFDAILRSVGRRLGPPGI